MSGAFRRWVFALTRNLLNKMFYLIANQLIGFSMDAKSVRISPEYFFKS